MHVVPGLKVLYFGTPVVLISTLNEDGTPNLAPNSSAWWLNQSCMIGLGNSSRTTANLRRERECVLNLPSAEMVDAVDRIALLTGTPTLSEFKTSRGYRHERDKFGAAGLTPQPSETVAAPRVAECPIQVECRVAATHPFAGAGASNLTGFELEVLRVHVDEDLVMPGTQYVDPVGWDPLIMKFCEYFGGGHNVHPSSLAEGWKMPHRLSPPVPAR
ncbi:flavin reductase family protein [Kitasatospora sp. NPDC101183]|uniref:flavin reductase family protein n=1 Tax=Kitasatospora sp. NPDC101183 TaxID=3364100 RepID=UPI00382D91CB